MVSKTGSICVIKSFYKESNWGFPLRRGIIDGNFGVISLVTVGVGDS
jgi:hypothetical protein